MKDQPMLFDRFTPSLDVRPLPVEEKLRVGAEIGETLKERALGEAEESHADDLAAARLIRDRLAIENGEVDASMVRAEFERYRGVDVWGSWAGALFTDGLYVPTGEWRKSQFATRHGAVVRVWRRK